MAYRDQKLPVTAGGTGLGTLTSHAIQIGAGTSSPTQLGVGTNGQVLVAATTADPAFATLSSTAGSITYTTGANTLNLDIVNYVGVTSWTPALTFGGGNTGITYTAQTGKYVRIGPIVFIAMILQLSNKGSSTGVARITGLPVTSGGTGSLIAIPASGIGVLTFTGIPFFSVDASATTMQILLTASGGGVTSISDTNFANNTSFQMTGFYMIA